MKWAVVSWWQFLAVGIILCGGLGQIALGDCSPELDGDLNGDCKVDFIDLAIFAKSWLKVSSYQPTKPAEAVHCFYPIGDNTPAIWENMGDDKND
ncbi:hypothetical protein ES707_21557 [subsurface metagenome]